MCVCVCISYTYEKQKKGLTKQEAKDKTYSCVKGIQRSREIQSCGKAD